MSNRHAHASGFHPANARRLLRLSTHSFSLSCHIRQIKFMSLIWNWEPSQLKFWTKLWQHYIFGKHWTDRFHWQKILVLQIVKNIYFKNRVCSTKPELRLLKSSNSSQWETFNERFEDTSPSVMCSSDLT